MNLNGIRETSGALRSGKISCVELARAYLDAAERRNAELRAFVSLTEETALAQAAAADERLRGGGESSELLGVPFVLKDNISTAGLRTTCASRMLENYVPIYDAAVWELLRAEGAVLIGKGNMDEFAMGSTNETSYFGGARNPRDTSRVAGGSSGGVAAAVAAGLAVYGIGSDTGGSIRQPASFCGLVGLKPTYGAVSRRGLIAYASSLDQIGPITRSARDAAAVFDAICRRDGLDMTSRGREGVSGSLTGGVKGLRIGIAREFFENLPPDIDGAVKKAAGLFEDAGAELVEVSFPLLKYSLPAYYILACAEASSNLGRYDGLRYGYRTEEYSDLDEFIRRTRSEGFGAEVRRRILLGTYVLSAGYYDAYYNKAQKLRAAIKNEFAEIFTRCDCLLTPTVPVTALPSGGALSPVETYQTDICTVPVNIVGAPAVSAPCGFDTDGLPIGMQLIGDAFREDILLNAAFAFEEMTERKYLTDAALEVIA
ncbi:MAG: Asp-tRNA(Asn)/Glu-tRNA(Gln) amidotransferase subunit GatA [Oscillospiraceae bacterium]|jgi:aspartyl-tRNA(Asn)/glutamyl-tRNA(Gln) amidotransferase subunit A|nr:Asp-tRNA(Asn)/Glu-tRNA(Gln) amidotransferase subunit GatA [Oscillospiraceae bacterium]